MVPVLKTVNPSAKTGTRRRLAVNGMALAAWLLIVVFLGPAVTVFANSPDEWQAYGLLLDYIQAENRNGPLVEFVLTGQNVDTALSRENREFISKNKPLLEKIRAELDSQTLNWELRQATQRLMVVPETHAEYAALFESYCRAVIDHVLQQTRLPNPYGAIATLDGPPAEPLASGENGITAYLVHNIADVYTEEYVFFDDRRQDRKISIKLDNRIYRGEIGSYTSRLVVEEDHHYSFEREAYTLWRNSAENPLNVLIAPVEETLHIALREATEAAIRTRLAEKPPATLGDIEAVVDEWLAVEEAMVGGLVKVLMPDILDRFLDHDSAAALAQSFADRQTFDQYRYLPRGIEVVDRLGLDEALRIYRARPREFKALLSRPVSAEATEPPASPNDSESAETDPAV